MAKLPWRTVIVGFAVTLAAGAYIFNLPARLDDGFDARCSDTARFIVSDQGRVFRLHAGRSVRTLYNVDRFQDEMRRLFDRYRELEYGTPRATPNGFVDLAAVTKLKVLPPAHDFLDVRTHNFSMGPFYEHEDIDGDGIREPVFSSVQTRCSDEPITIKIPSRVMATAEDKLWLNPINARFLKPEAIPLRASERFRNLLAERGIVTSRPFHVGLVADFDGDGMNDFWVADPDFRKDDKVVGRADLVLAKSLNGDGRSIDELASVTIMGEPDYPNSSVNRFGYQLPDRAADVTGDGRPDFVSASHYEFDSAGVLYVLPGSYIASKRHWIASDPCLIRVVGKPLIFLGTGLAIADYMRDGRSDILIGADVDHEAGFGAGAAYLVGGRQLTSASDPSCKIDGTPSAG